MELHRQPGPTGPSAPPETTLFRTSPAVGFNARVEPIRHTLERLEPSMGWFRRWREKRKLNRFITEVKLRLPVSTPSGPPWDERQGACVCNMRIAKLGVLSDLRHYASQLVGENPDLNLSHVIHHRDRDAYYIPVDFPLPMAVQDPSSRDHIPVGSSLRLLAELDEINTFIQVEKTFKLHKMVDFLDATGDALGKYQSTFGTDPTFWIKFGFVVLRKLAEKSVEHKLPIIFV